MGFIHTVKLVNIMDDRLNCRSVARYSVKQPKLVCLDLIVLEDNSQWKEEDRHDDSKYAKAPAPPRAFNNCLRKKWASECSADEGCADEGEGEGSVFQSRRIGDEDIKDEVQCAVANVEDSVSSCIAVGSIARSHDDDTDYVDAQEENKAFSASPNVQKLGDWQLYNTANDGGQDISGGDLRCGGKARVCVVECVEADGRLKGKHEEANPDPGISR